MLPQPAWLSHTVTRVLLCTFTFSKYTTEINEKREWHTWQAKLGMHT